jgi:hypothetical protein
MAIDVVQSPWSRLVQWAQIQQNKSGYQCIRDVQLLIEWETGRGLASRAWQCVSYLSTKEPLTTENEKFEALKKRLLEYVEAVPEEDSLTITQMDNIQKQIEQNETLAEMWNCTKKYYFDLARKGQIDNEFPAYAFGFTSSGSLAKRVKAIQAQFDNLNQSRSQAFETVTTWLLNHTSLTHASVPKMIAQEFTNITVLYMTHNKFRTLGDFSRLDKLRILHLSENRLLEIPAAHLPLSLVELALDKNQLEQQPDLTRLIALRHLNLYGNPFGASLNNSLLPPNLEKSVS